ncbi:MAG: dephospho-CoA kinase [Acidobacteriaceae bacterium]|jgi:dephospho-CoA kinase|nr:dephospho-CoA kinase [Acidobacteriaceae bacterium]
MLRVALTGGIATGKSDVLDRCLARGIPCLDADALAHGVLAPGTEATQAVAERFGVSVIDPSGAVSRRALGAIVFADAAARRDLERIVHPAVYRAIAAGLRGFELIGGAALAVVAIPLLYETGRAADFDAVIVTTCSVEAQRHRLRARGLNDAEINQRLSAQMSAEAKASQSKYVIDTNGSFNETDRQLTGILGRITAGA